MDMRQHTGCVEGGHHRSGKGEPKCTCAGLVQETALSNVFFQLEKLPNSTENDTSESVAKDEFQNTTNYQKHATKESDRATVELVRSVFLRNADSFSLRE